MHVFKVAVVEQIKGIPYLFTCIKFDSSTSLFCDVEGDSLANAIQRDLEYCPTFNQIEIRLRDEQVTGGTDVIELDPIGAGQVNYTTCEIILIPVKELGDDHFILFCTNMKIVYNNLRGALSQQPINLVQACDVKLHPTRGFMAFEGFGAVVGTLAGAELL